MLLDPIRKKYKSDPEIRKLHQTAYPDNESKKATPQSTVVDVSRLNIKVGVVKSVKKHPEADTLYVEEIDLGEKVPRTVVSGLVNFITAEELENKKVVVLCNLKPAKMRGIESQAMLLCASLNGKVELLEPPDDSVPGERVFVEGYDTDSPDEILNPKKKIFEEVQADLTTGPECVAMYRSIPLTTSQGCIRAKTLINATIR